MTAIGLALVGVGIVLVWSAIKDEDVRDVFRRTFTAGPLPVAVPTAAPAVAVPADPALMFGAP